MAQYIHQSHNQLVLDKIRSIQLDIDMLRAYLIHCDYDNAQSLNTLYDCSIKLFDEVYKPLKDSLKID